MGVMALFQPYCLQNACFRMRIAAACGHLCCIDTFLVLKYFLNGMTAQKQEIEIQLLLKEV